MASMDTAAAASPPGHWLDQVDSIVDKPIEPPAHLWGFGGLHGGLTLALLAKAMHFGADAGVLRSATVRLHRPVNQVFTVAITRPRRGRASADALPADGGRSCLASASLVTGAIRPRWLQPVAPDCPSVPPHGNCDRFALPPGLAPIGQFLEVRPTDGSRPYAGDPRPRLTAWLRLAEDDQPPDIFRLIMLMDALAPSYAAVLTTPQAIPTVELTVRYAGGLGRASSPWILLRASTTWVSADGWLNELLVAWDPTGTHLASADQVGTIIGSPPAAAARLEPELPA